MRAVIQRVQKSSVSVSGEIASEIGPGILIFIGVGPEDTEKEVRYLAEKSVHLRIFPDEDGKMNRSLLDTGGEMLIISQFTLYGDCRKGRRPSFIGAAPPELAEELIDQFVAEIGRLGVPAATGRFGAMMDVELINDGPVTLMLDSSGAF